MSYDFNKKVERQKPLRGEYVVTINAHKGITDEKGSRYLVQLAFADRTRDYYIFPSENDYEVDEEKGQLKPSQVNYLIGVFSRILDDYESGLIDMIDKVYKEKIQFMVNITWNDAYNRDNFSFYPVRETEEAPDL